MPDEPTSLSGCWALRGSRWNGRIDAWRVSVIGVFDLVDGHLTFDDSGVGSVGAGGEQLVICCGAVHQPPDRVVDAEVSVNLLNDPVGSLERSTTPGPR